VFHLWEHMCSKDLPLPPLHRLIPLIHSYWNAVKSGSDVITKLFEGCRFMHPHTNCNSRAVYRQLLVAIVVIHRLIQVKGVKVESHNTLRQLKNAASKRQCFQKSIQSCYELFLERAKVADTAVGQVTPDDAAGLRRSNKNQLPIRDFSAPRTNDTPRMTRLRHKQQNEITLNSEFYERIQKCKREGGHPIPISEHDKNAARPGRCWVCTNPTNWICAKCHRFLCNDRIAVSANDAKSLPKQKPVYRYEAFNPSRKENESGREWWTCVETCYQKVHFCEGHDQQA